MLFSDAFDNFDSDRLSFFKHLFTSRFVLKFNSLSVFKNLMTDFL